MHSFTLCRESRGHYKGSSIVAWAAEALTAEVSVDSTIIVAWVVAWATEALAVEVSVDWHPPFLVHVRGIWYK